jgi:hypothetical protein
MLAYPAGSQPLDTLYSGQMIVFGRTAHPQSNDDGPAIGTA